MRLLFAAVLITLAGCGGGTNNTLTKPEAKWAPPQNVAVVLFANQSNDEDGPVLVRLLTIDIIRAKGYAIQDAETTEKKLSALGITHGGQMGSIKPKDLAKKLGVDGLFYGTVVNFDYKIGILDTTKYVRVNLKFFDGTHDEKLWENEQEYKDVQTRVGNLLSLDAGQIVKDTARDVARDTVVKAVRKSLKSLLGHPLYGESAEAVERTLRPLPAYVAGYGYVND